MKKKAIILLAHPFEAIYCPEDAKVIHERLDILAPPVKNTVLQTHPEALADAEIIMSSWGMVSLDEELLAAAPKLEAVFYAAGSIRAFMTDAAWDRNITVCSAWKANAVPVAEYAFAQIILCLKRVYEANRLLSSGDFPGVHQHEISGAFRSQVGIVSLGEIGKRVIALLKNLEVNIGVYDPFLSENQAREMGVEKMDLETLFETSQVVSLHTPLLAETKGMINGDLLRRMPNPSAIINTARGGIIELEDMVAFLKERPQVQFVTDVFDPHEPPPLDHPYLNLPNVFSTPHIAGAVGNERWRLGHWMRQEMERYLDGQPLQFQVSRDMAKTMA